MPHTTYEVAVQVYGREPILFRDDERKVFFDVWTAIEREWEASYRGHDTTLKQARESRKAELKFAQEKHIALIYAISNYASKNPQQTQARKVIAGIRELARQYLKENP